MLLKEEVDERVRETRDARRQALTEFLGRHSLEDLKPQVYMLKGEAGILIPQLAKKKEVEVIVMSTVSGGGIAGLLLGDSPERMLHQVDCSILTVKPDGLLIPLAQVSA